MIYVNVVRAIVMGAISALEGRQQTLAPFERLKLKSLHLNLRAMEGVADSPYRSHSIPANDAEQCRASWPGNNRLLRIDEKILYLRSRRRRLWAENRMLHELLTLQVNVAAWHRDQVRVNVDRSRQTCADASCVLLTNSRALETR